MYQVQAQNLADENLVDSAIAPSTDPSLQVTGIEQLSSRNPLTPGKVKRPCPSGRPQTTPTSSSANENRLPNPTEDLACRAVAKMSRKCTTKPLKTNQSADIIQIMPFQTAMPSTELLQRSKAHPAFRLPPALTARTVLHQSYFMTLVM